MDAAHVARICSVVRYLEEMDLVQEFERTFNDDPQLFEKAVLTLFRGAPLRFTEKNLVKFDSYLEGLKQKSFSKELQIPEECTQLGRRRTFGKFLGDMLKTLLNENPAAAISTGVAIGAYFGHLAQHCSGLGDGGRCNGQAASDVATKSGRASFDCLTFDWSC